MKRFVFLSLLVCCTAFAVTGCSTVENVSVSSSAESTSAVLSKETAEAETSADELPVNDEFDYEIVEGKAAITGYKGSAAEVVVPAELGGAAVEKISPYAFEAKYDVTAVTLPETVTLIGEGAFMDCAMLRTINIPAAVTGIDRGAFVGCTSRTSLTIPAGVQYIREEAFTACEAMTLLTIENPDLVYENWGIEELGSLKIQATTGSAVAEWAGSMGKSAE